MPRRGIPGMNPALPRDLEGGPSGLAKIICQPLPWRRESFSSIVICAMTRSARLSGARLLSIHGPAGLCRGGPDWAARLAAPERINPAARTILKVYFVG